MTEDNPNRPQWMTDPDAMPSLEEALELAPRYIAEAHAAAWLRAILVP